MARIPLYRQAETEMLRRLKSGEWAPGQRLANEFGLADEFGVSQGTMRRALITLESQGYLSRKPGRGTIVADPKSVADQAAQGGASGGQVLGLVSSSGAPAELSVFRARARTRTPDAAEAAIFGPGKLHVLERTLKHNDTRAALEELLLPVLQIGATLDEEAGPDLGQFLGQHGLDPARIDTQAAARITTMGESVALSVDRYTALLVITRVAYAADGTVLARQDLAIADSDLTLATLRVG